MTASARPAPGYVLAGGTPVFTTLHGVATGRSPDTAVLLCPPFGWDEVCSYRSLRAWAEDLAGAGHPALRISYPSTGDSGGGVSDPGRLQAWTAAVTITAARLRAVTGAGRIVAVGMGLGGLLAHLAAAQSAEIDDLVLWGTPVTGRALVRQLRAFSRLERSAFFEDLPQPEPLPEGEMEVGGFRLSADTLTALSAVDLAAHALPTSADRRVLLLERDRIAPDMTFVAALERSGTAVTTAPGQGYAAMTSHPQTAVPARAVFATVRAWLAQAPPGPADDRTAGDRHVTAAPVTTAGPQAVRETPIVIPGPGGELAGILAEPAGKARSSLAVVLLNAGAGRRIGPNRMWVETGRRWAGRGVPVLRLDIPGLGDSDGDERQYVEDDGFYVLEIVPQVLSALDHLQRSGIAERFVLGGLCAGAYWAFHGAIADDRVVAVLMLNPRALAWDPALAPARDLRALTGQPFSLARARRSVTRRRILAVLRWLLATPRRTIIGRPARSRQPSVTQLVGQFLDTGTRGLILFSEREPLEFELIASGQIERLRTSDTLIVEHIAVRDHTLRPVWAQTQAHAALDRALEREVSANLSASGAESASGSWPARPTQSRRTRTSHRN